MADFATRRTTMVDTQVRPSDVTKFPIIEAMLAVPREDYVPDAKRAVAYAEQDIVLDETRVVLAPRSFAKLLEESNIGREDVVLDLGCGLGYSSAVIARLCKAVVGIEDDEARADEAQKTLSAQGVDNAAVICAPLTAGDASSAPFDVIVVNGAIETWPDTLSDQLREGGRIVAIWSEGRLCTARIGLKHAGKITWRDMFSANAPVLPGFERARDFAL